MMHPRTEIVRKAKTDLLNFLIAWQEKHKLTLVEEAQLFMDQIDGSLKYMLREERHPGKPDYPADRA